MLRIKFQEFKVVKKQKKVTKMNDFRELKEPRPFNADEQRAIDELKQIFKQNIKINFQTDNYFLTKFLRYRDWNVQAAYESIQSYYKIKVNEVFILLQEF